MLEDEIESYILDNFQGVIKKNTFGESSFFYNPNRVLPNGVYFCTIKNRDGKNDKASNLGRTDIFRFNLGISKDSFKQLFNQNFKRPLKGEIISGNFDFQKLDLITPHPIYGWMSWVSILNPSTNSFKNMEYLLIESYKLAISKFNSK